MKKRNKFLIIKTAGVMTAVGLLTAITNFKEDTTNYQINYSSEDLINNENYLYTLNAIQNETPVFQNTELYNYICKELNQSVLYESDLKKIYNLHIKDELKNQNFEDLKYLTNLKILTIENNNLDGNNLYYNDNLTKLDIINGTISNTQLLPNSINSLTLDSSTIIDNNLTIPYLTKYLTIVNCNFNNLTLKQSDSLEYLYIHGDSFLDLNSIANCQNLKFLTLNRISNVKNSEVLLSLNIEDYNLDDYCTIWMNTETLNLLQKKIKKSDQYISESQELDYIANSINSKKTSEEKIKSIIVYIIDNLEYDIEVSSKTEQSDFYTGIYNDSPIEYALKGKGICINYASLFQALANRTDIESYQLYSDTHGWNAIAKNGQLHYIDPTFLDNYEIYTNVTDSSLGLIRGYNDAKDVILNDNEEKLYYYDFDSTLEDTLGFETHKANNLPVISIPYNNIGYVDFKKDISTIYFKFDNKIYKCNRLEFYAKYLVLFLILDIIRRSIGLIKDEQENKKEYKKEQKLHSKALKLRNTNIV